MTAAALPITRRVYFVFDALPLYLVTYGRTSPTSRGTQTQRYFRVCLVLVVGTFQREVTDKELRRKEAFERAKPPPEKNNFVLALAVQES